MNYNKFFNFVILDITTVPSSASRHAESGDKTLTVGHSIIGYFTNFCLWIIGIM